MELERLRQLEAIEREGTMSAAAQVLHLSQPALSRSLGRLERELGSLSSIVWDAASSSTTPVGSPWSTQGKSSGPSG